MAARIRITLNSPFGELVLSSYACKPLDVNHPHRQERLMYFSNNKYMTVKLNGVYFSKRGYEVWFDERCINTITLLPPYNDSIVPKEKQAVFDWIKHYHTKMKLSDPLYGTHEWVNHTHTGSDGELPLYMHDFFAYIKTNHRDAKLERLITEFEAESNGISPNLN